MEAGFHLAKGLRSSSPSTPTCRTTRRRFPGWPRLLAEFDVVCGVRAKRQDTWWKRRSSRIANGFRNWATGDDIVDTGCTLKAYRR